MGQQVVFGQCAWCEQYQSWLGEKICGSWCGVSNAFKRVKKAKLFEQ